MRARFIHLNYLIQTNRKSGQNCRLWRSPGSLILDFACLNTASALIIHQSAYCTWWFQQCLGLGFGSSMNIFMPHPPPTIPTADGGDGRILKRHSPGILDTQFFPYQSPTRAPIHTRPKIPTRFQILLIILFKSHLEPLVESQNYLASAE
jgi:hypothetical protein